MSDSPAGTAAPLRRILTIRNRRGLHARAAAKFAQAAGRYDARIAVSRGPHRVSGTSIMGLMMLGAAQGVEVVVEAEGPEAEPALQAIVELVEGSFGEC